ncbi:CynX/NimT family MFS transporter [Trujillonella endophytica]|uniref:MFS transporter, CP family, cyanate transporter n=1 Tax=Trujillonella endophytica TaxID=673521 RepID=A0A1H8UH82_9ACTN|nr:MFS transporter [Trujillella endophytica]SEP01968.1 MFS transporter, CP family, cyanate transporter [Trujillella endophytica]
MSSTPDAPPAHRTQPGRRVLWLVATAIVLTALNLRTAVNSVGPVLEELENGLGISSGAAGLITTMPVLCFAVIGFAGPPLAARYRDGHVLAGALLAMAAGLVVRAVAGSFALFLVGTVLAMVGGALGNVLLPSLVKRYFPSRTGLLVGAYSAAMAVGGAIASVSAAPLAEATGADGWRWALGIWAALAMVAVLPWLAVPARPGSSRESHAAVRMRSLARSPMAIAMALFFGLQAMQAYIVVGWSAQYLRDSGLSAASAGLLLGLNTAVVIPINAIAPALTVRPHLQRPLLLTFMGCYVVGWLGLWQAPGTAPWLWMSLLAVGLGTFAMALTLMGLRARTPETTAALSTVAQGWGYLLAGVGPLLVGVLRGSSGGYTGMFVVALVGVSGLTATGWLVTRQRYVDDDVPGWSPAGPRDDVVEVAGTEPPVAVHVREPGGGSPRG